MARVLALGIDVMKLACMRHLAEDGFQKCALSRAVRADQRGQLAAVDMQVDVVENREASGFDAEILNLRAAELRAVVAGRRMMMQDGLEQK